MKHKKNKSRKELIEKGVDQIWYFSWMFEEFIRNLIRKELETWKDHDLKSFFDGENNEEE